MGIEDLQDVLTVKQIAEYLQLNEITIKRALRNKELKGFKVGNNWRIQKKDLLIWIKGRENY